MVGHADLGGHGVDRAVLPDVTLPQVAGHVRESEPVQHGAPPGVWPGRALPGHRGGRRRGDVREMARQPVLVQPGLAADRRQAGPVGRPGQDERAQVRVAATQGHVRRDPGEMPAGPLGVRPRHQLARDARPCLPGLPAALLRMAAAGGGRRRVPAEFPGAGPLPPGSTARADRGVEHQPGGERGRAQLAGVRALQGLAALQAEDRAVGVLGVPVHAQVGGDRPECPAAQVADHPRVGGDHLADRGEDRGAVREDSDDRAGHAVSPAGPVHRAGPLPGRAGRRASHRVAVRGSDAVHLGGHGQPSGLRRTSHNETTEAGPCRHGRIGPRRGRVRARAGAASRRGPRHGGRRAHYAQDHERGAITVAGGTHRPGDPQRAARARVRHRPADRARRRTGPHLAGPPAGHLPLDHPAAGRRAGDAGRGGVRPGPAAHPLRGDPGRTAAGGGMAGHAGRARPGRPVPPATQAGPAGPRRA